MTPPGDSITSTSPSRSRHRAAWSRPLSRDVARRSVSAVAADLSDLAARARDGKLAQHEIEGGAFCVSNLGMYGTEEFAAIINPPQSAILAVGAAREEPVVEHGAARSRHGDAGDPVGGPSANRRIHGRRVDAGLRRHRGEPAADTGLNGEGQAVGAMQWIRATIEVHRQQH